MDNLQQLAVDQAKSLDDLKKMQGWFILQSIISDFERDRLNDLLGYKGSDKETLRSLHISARVIKELKNAINQQVDYLIQVGKQVLIDNAIEEEIL